MDNSSLLKKFESVRQAILSENESIDDHFSEYHHYEEYDPDKKYPGEPYEHD